MIQRVPKVRTRLRFKAMDYGCETRRKGKGLLWQPLESFSGIPMLLNDFGAIE